MDLDELTQRFDSCQRHIRQIRQQQMNRDCSTMARATERLLADVSTAAVECRRLHKTTPAYQQALTRAEQSIRDLERYIMMAQLMS